MNFKKEFSRLNALSHKDPKWYCNFDKKTGVIYSVKNHNNDSDSYITIEHTLALEFNNRDKSLDDYQIVWNKDQKKYKLLKKSDTTIESIKNTLAKGTQPEPKLTLEGNKEIGYYPILTNKMCMQCHGKINTEIKPETLIKIKNL